MDDIGEAILGGVLYGLGLALGVWTPAPAWSTWLFCLSGTACAVHAHIRRYG